MAHLDRYIQSNIYYAYEGSEIFRFARTTSDINTLVTLSNYALKRTQKQGEVNIRSMISILNKIFDIHLTVFKVFADATANFTYFFYCLKLQLYIHTCACYIAYFCCSNFRFFVCLLFRLFVCFCVYRVTIAYVSTVFVSMHMLLFAFLWFGILYCNFTIV